MKDRQNEAQIRNPPTPRRGVKGVCSTIQPQPSLKMVPCRGGLFRANPGRWGGGKPCIFPKPASKKTPKSDPQNDREGMPGKSRNGPWNGPDRARCAPSFRVSFSNPRHPVLEAIWVRCWYLLLPFWSTLGIQLRKGDLCKKLTKT